MNRRNILDAVVYQDSPGVVSVDTYAPTQHAITNANLNNQLPSIRESIHLGGGYYQSTADSLKMPATRPGPCYNPRVRQFTSSDPNGCSLNAQGMYLPPPVFINGGSNVQGLVYNGQLVTDDEEFLTTQSTRIMYDNTDPLLVTKFHVSYLTATFDNSKPTHDTIIQASRIRVTIPDVGYADYTVTSIVRGENGIIYNVSPLSGEGIVEFPENNVRINIGFGDPVGQPIDVLSVTDGTYFFEDPPLVGSDYVNSNSFFAFINSGYNVQGRINTVFISFSVEAEGPGMVEFTLVFPLRVPLNPFRVFLSGTAQDEANTEVIPISVTGFAPEAARVRMFVNAAGTYFGYIAGTWIFFLLG